MFSYQRVVMDIEVSGQAFYQAIHDILWPVIMYSDSQELQADANMLMMQIYQESLRQLFDSMSPDFQDYTLNLLTLPMYDRFVRASALFGDQTVQAMFREALKEFGISIYFVLMEHGLFHLGRSILLDHPGIDCLVVQLAD